MFAPRFGRLEAPTVSWRAVVPLVTFMMVMILPGCADSRGGPIPYNVSDFGQPDLPSSASLGAGYRIAPLDTVSVKVFRVADLSGDYEIDLTGQLAMPLVGNIPAADLTVEQLDTVLTEKLGSKYLVNPDVTVSLKASSKRVVTVDGAVNRAGAFPVLGPATLMQVVALAGGAAPDANIRRVAIFRQIAGKRQAAAFDLASIRTGEAADPQIYAGDIVVIDGSSIKAVQKKLLQTLPVLSIFGPL